MNQLNDEQQHETQPQSQTEIKPETEELGPLFKKAIQSTKNRNKFFILLYILCFFLILIGQLKSFKLQCKFNYILNLISSTSAVNKWGFFYLIITIVNLFFYFRQQCILKNPSTIRTLNQIMQTYEGEEEEALGKMLTQIKFYILSNYLTQLVFIFNQYSQQIPIITSILLNQASIISFTLILVHQNYHIDLEPLPYFSGNCQDFLLNVIFIIYMFQIGVYLFFYISIMLALAFSPIFLAIMIILLTLRCWKKLREKNIIRTLPIRIQENTAGECSICLNQFEAGQRIKILGCNHEFHETCIDEWIKMQFICPLCRKRFGS